MSSQLFSTEEPGWLEALEQVMSHDYRASDRLPLGILTREIEHWCDRARAESWKRLLNPRSLLDDIHDTLTTLGPHLKAQVLASSERLANEAQCLQGKPGPTEEQTAALCSAAVQLRSELSRPAVVEAAWRDAWKAAKQEEFELLRWRMLCLTELLELRGRDPRLAAVDVAQALHGWRLDKADNETPDERTLAERLDAAGEALSTATSDSPCVVWLVYDNATLQSNGHEVGSLTFYEADWAVPNAAMENGQQFAHREELRELLTSWQGNAWNELSDRGSTTRNWIVLARVDLGTRSPYGAIEAADQVVQTMVQVAAVQWGGSPWTRVGPAGLLVDGRGPQTIFDRFEATSYAVAERRVRTARGLAERGSVLADALTGGSMRPDLVDAVRLLHEAAELDWATEGSRSARTAVSNRTAVVLEDGAVEHLASVAGMKSKELDSYVLGSSAHDVWESQVRRVVEMCLRAVSRSPGKTRSQVLRSQLGELNSTAGVSLALVGDHVEDLIEMYEPGIWRNHARQWLDTLGSPEKYLAAHQTLTVSGAKLARRAERVRNSLVHGNPADQGVVTSIRPISRYRAYTCLDIALESVSRGVPMSTELERRRKLGLDRMRALKDGLSLVEYWRLSV
jgi:hypothetical protein